MRTSLFLTLVLAASCSSPTETEPVVAPERKPATLFGTWSHSVNGIEIRMTIELDGDLHLAAVGGGLIGGVTAGRHEEAGYEYRRVTGAGCAGAALYHMRLIDRLRLDLNVHDEDWACGRMRYLVGSWSRVDAGEGSGAAKRPLTWP